MQPGRAEQRTVGCVGRGTTLLAALEIATGTVTWASRTRLRHQDGSSPSQAAAHHHQEPNGSTVKHTLVSQRPEPTFAAETWLPRLDSNQ